MQFPLKIAFKLLTLVPQLSVRDATGAEVGYVKSKLFAFKEDVTVFADATEACPIYAIRADRVIDFTANYYFADADGNPLGYVRREGLRSLWRASYRISVGDQPVFAVREASALVRLADSLLGGIPFVGLLSGYVFNPRYVVTRIDGGDALVMTKRPALLETDFTIDQTGPISSNEQACALLGLMMIVLLERARG